MICEKHQTIEDYLSDGLSPADETEFEAHLESCATCREALVQQAGPDSDWSAITTALQTDDFDTAHNIPEPLAWPMALLGASDDPRMLGRIGPFEVSGCVGVGGMGVVFKARDPALDRYVAVKVLSPQLAASEIAKTRFHREAKAAAAVVHDNVIAVHQVSRYQGLPYLVMPYLPGPSLEQRLRKSGPMPIIEALRVARQVAAGLAAAHEQGLIHRDIKPANILLSGNTERAILTDFGLARAADDATLTRSGALAGTPQFMAPEQARGEPTDAKSDLFSLGALLFAMLTGRPAVRHLSGAETVRQVGSQPPLQLCDIMQDVPGWLNDLLNSLHAFDSSRRLKTAAAAERAICHAMNRAGKQTLIARSAPADSQPLPSWYSRIWRNRKIAWTTVAGLVAIFSVMVATQLLRHRSKNDGLMQTQNHIAANDRAAAADNSSEKSSLTFDAQPAARIVATADSVDAPIDEDVSDNEPDHQDAQPSTIRIVDAEDVFRLLQNATWIDIDTDLRTLESDIDSLENR